MKGINGKAILKASEIISEITEKGNLKKYRITPCEFYEFFDTVQELYKSGTCETISENVKNLCIKCGFFASVQGVGWKIDAIV